MKHSLIGEAYGSEELEVHLPALPYPPWGRSLPAYSFCSSLPKTTLRQFATTTSSSGQGLVLMLMDATLVKLEWQLVICFQSCLGIWGGFLFCCWVFFKKRKIIGTRSIECSDIGSRRYSVLIQLHTGLATPLWTMNRHTRDSLSSKNMFGYFSSTELRPAPRKKCITEPSLSQTAHCLLLTALNPS